MSQEHVIRPVAHIRGDFTDKFGIPRQAGLVDALSARVVFTPEFRNADALRGIEGFSHLWLIWQFSESVRDEWSPTVRPPRLGGNERVGVFATRSPFRPNALGLSCVRLVGVEEREGEGTVLIVAGADMLDGTPIYDIKPYIAYADAHAEARCGFAAAPPDLAEVEIPPELEALVPQAKRAALIGVLAQDPRPKYQHDPNRVYAMDFAGMTVKFTAENKKICVKQIEEKV